MKHLVIFFILICTSYGKANGEQDISIDHCQASASSCNYYQCIEKVIQCGPEGYPLHFGKAKCEAYLKNQKIASSHLKKWYPEVRRCLQENLTKILNQKNGPENCEELQAAAFQSHVDCYVQTGFCDLSWLDRITIGSVAGLTLFGTEAVKTSLAMSVACSENHK